MVQEPVAERFQQVGLTDRRGSVEVGRGAGYPPGTVEGAGGETTLLGPPLQQPAPGAERGVPTEAGGLELGVEAALP